MSDSNLAGIARRESPLVEIGEAASGPVEMQEQPFLAQVNLRGNAADAEFIAAVREVLGIALPTEPNSVAGDGSRLIAWLGPDEWLLIDAQQEGATLAAQLGSALSAVRHAVNDVSAGYTTIRLRGALAAALIARGCSLDLHADVFPVGRCAQSHIAKAVVLLLKVDDGPCFDIVVRRSFADYLWRWLAYINAEVLGTA